MDEVIEKTVYPDGMVRTIVKHDDGAYSESRSYSGHRASRLDELVKPLKEHGEPKKVDAK